VGRIARFASPVALVGALLSIGVRGAQLAGASFVELFAPETWRLALGASTCAGLILTVAGLAATTLRPKRKLFAFGGTLLAAAGLGLTSHAALAEPIWASFGAYVIHAAVAAFWFGSLPGLAFALAREPIASAQVTVTRFSALAMWAVAGLLLAGIVLTLVQSGPDLSVWLGPAWTYGGYGVLLAGKLALVAVVLLFAIRNKRLLTPLLMRRKSEASTLLRRSIAWETAAMSLVVALAAALGSSVPPRSIAALQSEQHHAHAPAVKGAVVQVVRNGVECLIEADPAAPGPNSLIVHFRKAESGAHFMPMEVTVAASLPARGIEPLRRTATKADGDAFRVDGVPLMVPGVWQITVEALVSDFDKMIVTVDLPIGTPAR
jgi:copper transport protein